MSSTFADLPPGTPLIANPNLVLREEDDEDALLFDPETGSVHILNGSAVAVWKLLDGKRDREQIVAALREEYEGMDETAGQQVRDLLDLLYAAGAVMAV